MKEIGLNRSMSSCPASWTHGRCRGSLSTWRLQGYLDRWSLLDTWANQEPPIEDALVSIPAGQAILLAPERRAVSSIGTEDEDTPQLLILTVEGGERKPRPREIRVGVLVFDNKDIHLQATYIWVKATWLQTAGHVETRPFRVAPWRSGRSKSPLCIAWGSQIGFRCHVEGLDYLAWPEVRDNSAVGPLRMQRSVPLGCPCD